MTRILHISVGMIRGFSSPEQWLMSIPFYTGILKELSRHADVESYHCPGIAAQLSKDGVIYRFFKRPFIRALMRRDMLKAARSFRPDVVIVHSLNHPALVMAFRLFLPRGTRIFIQHHAERPLRFHRQYLQMLADKLVHGYFFASADLADGWLAAGLISSSRKIHVVMEGSSAFTPGDPGMARAALGIPFQRVYLWVGRPDTNKDPKTVIEAFTGFLRSNPNAGLYMIFKTANDTMLENLKVAAAASLDQVKFIPAVAHNDLEKWYRASDFIISSSHYEGSGIAVCEGMSCGCIPVVTDIPSFKMMTDNGEIGQLFKPGDSSSLYDCLQRTQLMNVASEKLRIRNHFEERLSFTAIAEKIYRVVSG